MREGQRYSTDGLAGHPNSEGETDNDTPSQKESTVQMGLRSGIVPLSEEPEEELEVCVCWSILYSRRKIQ